MRRLPALALAFVATTCVVVFAEDAAAQQPNLTAQERQDAKRLFDQAHLAYRRGNYEEAIIKWEQSYEISQHPLIFESMSHAYERLGKLEEALDYLTRWREHAERTEHRALDDRIENLRARVEQKQAEDRKRKEREDALQRERDALEERERAEQERKSRPAVEPTTEDVVLQTILPWSLIGTGAAAFVGGLVMDGVASSSRPDEAEACLQSQGQLLCRASHQSDIESSNTLAIAGDVTWILGLTMAAAGGALLIIGELGDEPAPDDAPATEVSLAPFAGPASGGVVLVGSF